MGPFKSGAARMAHYCDVPVWCLAMVGSDEVWPRGRAFPRLLRLRIRRPVVLVLGDDDIVTVSGDAAGGTEKIRDRMVDLLHEAVDLRAAPPGSG